MDSGINEALPHWKVISEGRLYPGVQLAKIKPGLCASLDLGDQDVERILEGERHALASFSSQDEAENAILKLQVLGLVVSLEYNDGSGSSSLSRVQRQQQEKRKKQRYWWVLTPLVGVLLALAFHYQSVPVIPLAGSSKVAKAHSDNLQHGASLQVLSIDELRAHLEQQNYNQLHTKLNLMQRNFANDAQWEYPLVSLLALISPANAISKAQLDRWVSQHDSAFSFLLRAYHALNQLRAGSEDPTTLIAQAYADFIQAQERDSNLLPVYSGLIALSAWQEEINAKQILEQAVNYFPMGYAFWHEYALLQMPSWHAYLWAEPDFLSILKKQIKFNPRLSAILAYRQADYAMLAKQAGLTGLCLRFFNRAFELGYTRDWLIQRAECALSAQQYTAAHADLTLAQALRHSPYVSSLLSQSRAAQANR